jgi:hypothetical protein
MVMLVLSVLQGTVGSVSRLRGPWGMGGRKESMTVRLLRGDPAGASIHV